MRKHSNHQEEKSGSGISFLQMATDRTACKFPLTDNMPHRFCGKERKVGSVYCEAHDTLCHTTHRSAS